MSAAKKRKRGRVPGPPQAQIPEGAPLGALEGRKGGVLLAVSPRDGETLATYPLPSPPVPDGVVIVPGRVLLSLAGGGLLCLRN